MEDIQTTKVVPYPPKIGGDEGRLAQIAHLLRNAKAPLIVIGKGAAYARAESWINALIEKSQIPFLPTPMGKGVLPDSHPLNTASARSTALREADVVLLLGARLNWILHFGFPPKWSPDVQFIQIDICPTEIGSHASSSSLGIVGDINSVIPQLLCALGTWSYNPSVSSYTTHLSVSKSRNEALASKKGSELKLPMTYSLVFTTIRETLHTLSPPTSGGIVYVSEGANTMDISRSIFPVSYPRLRLDAGTYATMGVGLGYAIAAHEAYNGPAHEAYNGPPHEASPAPTGPKKIVALEGDSAFGFSAMEIETMARYNMDILIFVLNNGGVYHGDSDSADEWLAMQRNTTSGQQSSGGLRSTSLGFEVGYEKIAQACGGLGFSVRTVEELEKATREGFQSERVCVVNVMIESGKGGKLEFGWQGGGEKKKGKGKEAKL